MVRPRRRRRVGCVPSVTDFKPVGISSADLEQVLLSIEECEALRLSDYLNFSQQSAAQKMGVSQPTFHRLVTEGRRKVAEALIFGKLIRVTTRGEVIMEDKSQKSTRKLAVSAGAAGLEGQVDARFGRCSHFVIATIDREEIMECEVVQNPYATMRTAAGVSVAQMLAEQEIDVVITGEVGPRAADVLKQFGTQVIQTTGSVTKAIDSYIQGGKE